MFLELVNQVSAANVSLKTQNYSGRSEGAGALNAAGGSLQSRGRAGTALKSKKQKKPSPERDTVQSKGSSIDIRSEQKDYSDLERVSKMSKKSMQTEVAGEQTQSTLFLEGHETGSSRKREEHAVTAKKRRKIVYKQDSAQPRGKRIRRTQAAHGQSRPSSAQ